MEYCKIGLSTRTQAISLSVFLVESDEKGDNFSVILK